MGNHSKKINTSVVKCTSCFKSVSVPSRMVIYNYLTKVGDATVGELVKQVELSQPTVSYHLKEMKHSGLLTNKKIGKEVHYSINKKCPHQGNECILHGLEFPESREENLGVTD